MKLDLAEITFTISLINFKSNHITTLGAASLSKMLAAADVTDAHIVV